MDVIQPVTDKQIEFIRGKHDLNKKKINEAVKLLQEWLRLQPHLPDECDERMLERWLLRSKNSMEKTKSAIDMYFTARTVIPHLMTGWDAVMDPAIKYTMHKVFIVPLSTLTSDADRIIIYGKQDGNPAPIQVVDILRILLMIHDVRLREEYHLADTHIFDFENLSLSFLSGFTPHILKQIEKILRKCYLTRMKSVHLLNFPSYAEFVLDVAKAVLKPKLVKRIYIHKDIKSLHQHVPREKLPTEYGGDGGPLLDMWGSWRKKLGSYRECFLQQERLKSDESMRIEKNFDKDDFFGIEGSFRRLDID